MRLIVATLLMTSIVFLQGPTLRSKPERNETQTLELKLSQKVVSTPSSTTTLGQLIEVAQTYRIPMGVEYVAELGSSGSTVPNVSDTTVRELITSILRQSEGYDAEKIGGVLCISKPWMAIDRRNFLNLQIAEFHVDRANVFDAEALLRLKIKMSLHPEHYAGGYGGGHGHAPGGFLDVRNITLSCRDLTVRDILNKIVAASGNALWVVRLTPSKTMPDEPFYAQEYLSGGGQAEDFYWKFIPFEESKSDNRSLR